MGGFYKRECQEKVFSQRRRSESVLDIQPLAPGSMVACVALLGPLRVLYWGAETQRNPGNPGTDGTFSDIFVFLMARLARVIAVGVPHHVTQRGKARRSILSTDGDRQVYLELLGEKSAPHQLSVLGYCVMSNHVHLVVIPQRSDAQALKQAHGRDAAYWSVRYKSTGHVWQGRYYSCPMDAPHLWEL